MGKTKKEHRKKVAKRNAEIKAIQNKFEKSRQDQLMELIQREKAAGAFNAPSKKDDIIVGAPSVILTDNQQGPII
jgi:hypothetical protein